jgi:hypothetical protein
LPERASILGLLLNQTDPRRRFKEEEDEDDEERMMFRPTRRAGAF